MKYLNIRSTNIPAIGLKRIKEGMMYYNDKVPCGEMDKVKERDKNLWP